MKFCTLPPAEAAGGILAHAVTAGARKFRKGTALSAADCAALHAAGVAEVVVALPQEGDLLEDAAAERVAAAFCGTHLRHSKASNGRVHIFSTAAGLLTYDAAQVHALNSVSMHITAATLPPGTPVTAGELLATIKIIPFALAGAQVARASEMPLPFCVRPFVRLKVGLIHTTLPATHAPALEKASRVTAARLAAYGAHLAAEVHCAHATAPLCDAIRDLCATHAPDALLIAGAQAIGDEADTVPAAVVAAGGTVQRVGMPVDPGNMLLLAQIGEMPVVGLPGCAKSPKLNGFDWVLARVLADIPPTAAEISGWGVGGLLTQTGAPPRAQAEPPRITALLLAAGAARRMGGENKLLRPWHGEPLLTHSARTIAAAQQQGIVHELLAVTGRDAEQTAAHLPAPWRCVHNPHYASGITSSLACGIRALSASCDAVLICLADMPRVQVDDLRAVCAAAASAQIVVPQHGGKRGNPVLLRRQLFPGILKLQGDTGARALFDDAQTVSVEAGAGVLFDVDTLAGFGGESGGDTAD